MKALFGRRGNELRTNPDAVEFALDLTPEAIIVHERGARGGWKKFASAQLDDPELPVVIGLLRSEAETQIGGREPVRLWLPGEQVLQRRTRIDEARPAARLRAAFDYIDRKTVYRPEDVAVAVAPANRDGEADLLITFAETWREARDYATRWGFIPGAVSTRHHAGNFGAEGPVFHLNPQPPEPLTRMRRNRRAVAALALAAVAASAAVWALRPWETPPGLPETAQVAAEAPAPARSPAPEFPQAALLPAPEPEARPETRPGIRIAALPPEHFPHTPALMPPLEPSHPPDTGPAPQAPGPPASPKVLAAAAKMAAAPLPPPDPGPVPPVQDRVAAWTGPVLAPEPPGRLTRPAAQAISGVMGPAAWIDEVSLLAKISAPTQLSPTVEPPPAEPIPTVADAAPPVELDGAPLPAPIPLPRPARTDPDAPTKFASLTSPLPKTRPAGPAIGPGLPLDRTALIGILNLDSSRKALLRLPNGRYRSVIVGDVLDGWQVSMIGVDAMRITRSGKDRTFSLVTR
ncbi:MAG: hypothetical protein ACTSVG_15005 [Alphaproteobacteria bacterium]